MVLAAPSGLEVHTGRSANGGVAWRLQGIKNRSRARHYRGHRGIYNRDPAALLADRQRVAVQALPRLATGAFLIGSSSAGKGSKPHRRWFVRKQSWLLPQGPTDLRELKRRRLDRSAAIGAADMLVPPHPAAPRPPQRSGCTAQALAAWTPVTTLFSHAHVYASTSA